MTEVIVRRHTGPRQRRLSVGCADGHQECLESGRRECQGFRSAPRRWRRDRSGVGFRNLGGLQGELGLAVIDSAGRRSTIGRIALERSAWRRIRWLLPQNLTISLWKTYSILLGLSLLRVSIPKPFVYCHLFQNGNPSDNRRGRRRSSSDEPRSKTDRVRSSPLGIEPRHSRDLGSTPTRTR